MNAISRAARAKFRQLAILDIDPLAVLRGSDGSVEYLLRAVEVADAIFWRQMMGDSDRESLLQRANGDDELKEMLFFNYGPYDRLNNDAPLLDGVPRKPPGAGFYPNDLTRKQFIDYVRTHRGSKAAFESPYTVIRRTDDCLTAIPFHEAYKDLIGNLRSLLSQAAALETDSSFREFLIKKAQDLGRDDFHASDSLWVNLIDNPVDLVIGPYEVYQDELMGLKAAYEGILVKRNFEESAKVRHFQDELPNLCIALERQLNRSLPVDERRVRISIADLVYAGGDAHKAIPAIAFNLPNDERIIEEVGARQVILRNVLEAKFRLVGWEIINQVVHGPPETREAAFQSFFTFTLFHEIAHSIGPHRIVKDGEETTVNRCLKQHFSTLEEAKADTLGACLTLNNTSERDTATLLKIYVGGLLRSIRFGFGEAHGGSNAIQFNYLLRAGAIEVNSDSKKISINCTEAPRVLWKLATDILDIQEQGDIDAAGALIANFRIIGCELEELVRQTAHLPIDVRIRFGSRPVHSTGGLRRLWHLGASRTEHEAAALQSK
jgi:peptidase M49-like protein